jgi:hypothetical protein
MPTNLPYSLDDLQSRINTLVNNDTDTPDSTDEEYGVILNLINQAIGKWESSDVMWDELWTTYTHGSTVAAGDTTYTITATDFRYPGGQVKLSLDGVDSFVPVISPEEYQSYNGEARVAYLTGNVSAGFVLNLGWSPATGDGTIGATISLPYYKYATKFTSSSLSTDKTEISDPNFLVYDVTATKALLESQNNKFSIFSTEAQKCMDNMRIMNDMKPANNRDVVEDVDALFGGIIGE